MKPILFSLLCLCGLFSAAQKFTLLPRFSVNTATAEQNGRLKNAYNLGAVLEMSLANLSPVKLAIAADAGINGSKRLPYELNFGSTVTKTFIRYTSYLFQAGAGLRYVLNEGKIISPYVGAGAGVMVFSTGYMIEDPEDGGGCRALDAENVLTDLAFTGRAEAGLRWLTKWKAEGGRRIALDFGVGYIRGTRADFIRLGQPGRLVPGTSYNAKFQTATNEVHEHAIGTRYNTPVSQLQYHVGIALPFGDD